MISYDTAVDVPKYAMVIARMAQEDDSEDGQTEHRTMQRCSSLLRLAAVQERVKDIDHTASDFATFFATGSANTAKAPWSKTTAWDEFSHPQLFGASAHSELVNVRTVGKTSRWAVASPSRMSPTFRLISKLTHLFETPEESRWPSVIWPNQSAFNDARSFLSKLPLAHIDEPEIRFAGDGEINFLWSGGDVHVDLGFYGTGTYSYYGYNNQGKEIQGEDVRASDGLTKPIMIMLTA